MKVKHAIFLLLLGALLDLFGIMKKVMHHPNAATFFIIATVLEVAGLLLMFFVAMHKKKGSPF
jgi:Na+/melibiose symporter-like transporter